MQIGERVRTAMNEQINHEFDSAYRYLAMSAWCEARDLPGCANWLRRQAEEEVVHAMKFFDFIQARDGAVVLQALPQPPANFPDVNAVFAGALAHEQHISALIHKLYALATSEGDFASQQFLQWFLAEQVEEEESASGVVARLALAGEHNVGLLLIDQELGRRVRRGSTGHADQVARRLAPSWSQKPVVQIGGWSAAKRRSTVVTCAGSAIVARP